MASASRHEPGARRRCLGPPDRELRAQRLAPSTHAESNSADRQNWIVDDLADRSRPCAEPSLPGSRPDRSAAFRSPSARSAARTSALDPRVKERPHRKRRQRPHHRQVERAIRRDRRQTRHHRQIPEIGGPQSGFRAALAQASPAPGSARPAASRARRRSADAGRGPRGREMVKKKSASPRPPEASRSVSLIQAVREPARQARPLHPALADRYRGRCSAKTRRRAIFAAGRIW